MIKIEKYDGKKTYMFPNGDIATPEVVLKKFPACMTFPHLVETDESGQVMFALQNIAAVRSHMGVSSSLNESDAIRKIEELRNTPVEYVPSAEERIASALEWQALQNL